MPGGPASTAPYKSAITRLLSSLLALGLCLALSAATAGGFTVTEEKVAQDGMRLSVRCNETQTVTMRLPAGAEGVKVLELTAGQVIRDGFGNRELARVQTVELRAGDPMVVEIGVVGSGAAATPLSPGACGSGWNDHPRTRISTRFLSPVPASVRREAHPLGTASCLK